MADNPSAKSPTASGLDRRALKYSASIAYDRRLYRHDIAGSIAHARMLGKQAIVSTEAADAIARGLEEILQEIEDGTFPWREELEDVHLNIEARLREKIGDAAARLHTARSRNDQVATDMRLFVMQACDDAIARTGALQSALLDLAEANRDVVVPGYTHLQRAQPVLLAHHLLAYFEMLDRDARRFAVARDNADELPLGSGALAGVPYDIDRDFVAKELGFSRVSRNSIAPLTVVRRDHRLVQRRVRLREAAAAVRDRLQHHAPETQPRCRRAGPWPHWTRVRQPDGDSDDAEGPSVGLQP
jgi:argininosuccinate lyase